MSKCFQTVDLLLGSEPSQSPILLWFTNTQKYQKGFMIPESEDILH